MDPSISLMPSNLKVICSALIASSNISDGSDGSSDADKNDADDASSIGELNLGGPFARPTQ